MKENINSFISQQRDTLLFLSKNGRQTGKANNLAVRAMIINRSLVNLINEIYNMLLEICVEEPRKAEVKNK